MYGCSPPFNVLNDLASGIISFEFKRSGPNTVTNCLLTLSRNSINNGRVAAKLQKALVLIIERNNDKLYELGLVMVSV